MLAPRRSCFLGCPCLFSFGTTTMQEICWSTDSNVLHDTQPSMTSTMGGLRGRRRHSALLLLALLLGVASASRTTPSRALGRYLKRKIPQQQSSSLEQHSGLHQVVLPAQPTVRMDPSRSISIDLVGEYLHETKFGNSSVSVAEGTQSGNTRVLRRRKRTPAYRGKKKSSKSSSSSNKGHGYYRPTRPILSKGSNSSKGKGGKKGKGGNGSKGSKGSKDNKGSKGSNGGISSKSLNKICRDLDFGEFYDGGYSYNGGSSSSRQKGSGGYYLVGKGGKGKRRQLDDKLGRSLQFEGQLCSPNTFDVASVDPDLSIFAELIEAANLQDIFLCAGT